MKASAMSRPLRPTFLLVTALLVTSTSAVAEAADPPEAADDTADEAKDDGIDIGGYGGLGVRYARLLHRNTALICVELALLFEHALSIGSSGCGTWMRAEGTTEESEADAIMLNFGGTIVRYHLMATEPISFSVGAAAGAGSIELEQDGDVRRTDSLIVLEPEVGVHTFVADWMRVSAVGAYRIVSGVDTGGVTSSDVSGFSVGINAHFGWF